jgi:drug/metabolite transporter (DMT)-like permease
LELGLWKFLGTTANLYGLSLTSASHGAFLIQLTTLIVPVVQGIMGVAIPQRIQWSVVLALAGVVCFAMDPTGTTSAAVDNTSSSTLVLEGDALCVVAAGFYATYDLRLFTWGKRVVPRQLITTKIATQAFLSVALLLFVASYDSSGIMSSISFEEWWTTTTSSLSYSFNYMLVVPCVLWSGVAVNAVAPFLQVGGQQVVGPTRCQTIYASQPLWAALLSFVFLGETVGLQGLIGATAFLSALALAATAEAPDPNCPQTNCEV